MHIWQHWPKVACNVVPFDAIAVLVVEDGQAGFVVVLLEAFNSHADVELGLDGTLLDTFKVVGLGGSAPEKKVTGYLCTKCLFFDKLKVSILDSLITLCQMGTHLRGKHFPLIASNNGDFFCAAKPECRRRFLIKDYGYYVRHFTRHYTQLCSLPKKQNTSGSCTHLWRKVETVLITAFFFCEGFAILYVVSYYYFQQRKYY